MKYSQVKEIILLARAYEAIPVHSIPSGRVTTVLAICERISGTYVECDDCGKLVSEGNINTVQYGRQVCDDCVENDYITCEHCGEITYADDAHTVHGSRYEEFWCYSCYERHTWSCNCCENVFSNDRDYITTHNDDVICESCYGDDYFTCGDCGDVFHHDDFGEDGCCDSCCDNTSSSQVIQNYSAKAENELSWGKPEARKPNKLYFGMELEVECGTDRGDIARNLMDECGEGSFILCEDGSLSDGFEIKTPPMSANELKEIATNICDSDARRHLRSHDGGHCGLHIHITRNALTQLQQGKLYEFVNKPANSKLVTAIARRYPTEGGYTVINPNAKKKDVKAAWVYDRDINWEPTKKVIAKTGFVNHSRYVAVNFTRNTVEMRITRGTLNKLTLLACIEWVAALVCFTRTGENNAGRAETTNEFLYWLTNNPERNKRWGNLTKYLVVKQFLPKTVLPRPRSEHVPDNK